MRDNSAGPLLRRIRESVLGDDHEISVCLIV